MKGIQYVVDDDGQKTAVVIDFKQYGELWEDLFDAFTAAQRRHEPRESLTQVKRRLQRLRKIKRNG
jgi:hypothetical protein